MMTQEWFNQVAWGDFVMWAFTHEPIREEFTRATRIVLPAADNTPLDPNLGVGVRSPIAQLIDVATGHGGAREQVLQAFVDWVTIHHWGLEFAPTKMRARLGGGS